MELIIFLYLSSLILLFTPNKVQKTLSLTLSIIALFIPFTSKTIELLSYKFILFDNEYSYIFALAFKITFAAGMIYNCGIKKINKIETAAFFSALASSLGIIYAGDYITLILFTEFLALASSLIIYISPYPYSKNACLRYLALHIMSGSLLLTGVAIEVMKTGSYIITHIENMNYFLFLSCLINLASPPFASFMVDAYSKASPSGFVFLQGFSTKATVLLLMKLFSGYSLLVYVGSFMIIYGIIYAILENNMRKILAYSIINQVGFMVVGVGIGSEFALYGASLHAFCHIIYKALLVMSAGSVMYKLQQDKCTNLGGLYKMMPITCFAAIIGGIAISGLPLTSGFVSKPIILEAAHYFKGEWLWYLLTAASAGVFFHAGIKFPWFVFFNKKDESLEVKEAPFFMLCAMLILSSLCLIIGIFPSTFYQIMGANIDYAPYSDKHMISQVLLLVASGFAFFLCLPIMARTNSLSLEPDYIIRNIFNILAKKIQLSPNFDHSARDRFFQSAYWIKRDLPQISMGQSVLIGFSLVVVLVAMIA